jgi:hypothetical protein
MHETSSAQPVPIGKSSQSSKVRVGLRAGAYLDLGRSFEERARDLVARLTPEDKVAQLMDSEHLAALVLR